MTLTSLAAVWLPNSDGVIACSPLASTSRAGAPTISSITCCSTSLRRPRDTKISCRGGGGEGGGEGGGGEGG
eukprot:7178749-Prymnesium_polylepis.1